MASLSEYSMKDRPDEGCLAQESTRRTLQDGLVRLAGEIGQAEDLLGINQPQTTPAENKISIGKIDFMIEALRELSKKMSRINDCLRGL